ncbi:helix-turn-helix transcriptional regulator [Eubacterium sp. 14-2]|uniref:helix-turn-helix domain-containing protein n=1 Tax=Eubacterium sp. 14-2 TaxID=1235790 RepID=UPI0009DB7146
MEKRVFGQKINYIRKSQKITSEQLAEMCDVNAGHIRQIESGIRLPSLSVV